MKKSEKTMELIKALTQVQKEIENPKKDAANPFFKSKYSTLDSVIDAYKDLCSKNDLVVLENPISKVLDDGKVLIGIEVQILHTSGQFISFEPFLLAPLKNDPQGVGSAITYARRYTLSSVFNIASEDDDDGNKASQKNTQKSTPPKIVSEEQYMLLLAKADELAEVHEMDKEKVRKSLNLDKGMTEIQFKQSLKRATDGIEKGRK